MKNTSLLILSLATLGLISFSGCSQSSADDSIALFNGKDLSGWEGDMTRWSVKDGAIVGQTTPDRPVEANTFLIWTEEEPANYELSLKFRLTGQNDKNYGNSGVQYRSRRIDAPGYVIGGYQADMDLNGKYVGMLYEEKGRGLIMQPGQKIRITPKTAETKKKATVEVLETVTEKDAILAAYNIGDWNELVIRAEGNELQHFLNGVQTAHVIDDDPANAAASGLIALQLHKGEPMTIEFKDIQLTKLD